MALQEADHIVILLLGQPEGFRYSFGSNGYLVSFGEELTANGHHIPQHRAPRDVLLWVISELPRRGYPLSSTIANP